MFLNFNYVAPHGMAAVGTLASIEKELVEAEEMHLSGTLTDALHAAMVRGSLALLPMPPAPGHIAVLKRLKAWRDAELIDVKLQEKLSSAVLIASRSPRSIPSR